jgi:excisionase family DNA binding protein
MSNNSMLLSIAECAEELRVSKSFLYRLAAAGILPTLKLGRRRMVRRSDILRFIQSDTEGVRRKK